MKIYERNDGGWKIEFIYSPFFEMLCSLHVLTKPEHHLERLAWAGGMKNKMGRKLYDEIMYFGTNFDEYCPVMDLDMYCRDIDDLNIIYALEKICEIDIENFVYALLGEKIEKDKVGNCIKHKSFEGLNLSKEQLGVFANPEGCRMRFISCLKEYYYLFFEKELKFIEPLLIRILKRQIEQYDSYGTLKYIDTLHSRIEVGKDALYFHKYTKFTVPFGDLKHVIIMPSSFIDPHLLIGIKNQSTLQLTIRAHLSEVAEEIPLDLFKTMRALGDETRLKILKNIYRTNSSTQSLSKELSLTEACISKHLKILYEADILYKERKGNYIYYLLNKMVLDRIPTDIYQYIDGGTIR